MRPLGVICATLLVLLAGCLAPVSDPLPSPAAPPAFRLVASGCEEGGGYVTWNAIEDNQAPPPLQVADVSADLGHPPVNNNGAPVPDGNVTGAYHATLVCPRWSLDGVEKRDLRVAWVGGRVHAPPFDPAPVARNYAISTIGVSDADLVAALLRIGIQAEALLGAGLSFDGDVMVSSMSFAHHGDIVSAVPVERMAAKPDETIRIWALSPEGDAARFVALDFGDRGGDHLVASGLGWFDHRTPSPQPPLPGVPIHEFSSWALAYRGVERVIEPGPSVDARTGAHGH